MANLYMPLFLMVEKMDNDAIKRLSPQRMKVLEMIGHGKSNKHIARQMHISPGTVRNHISEIRRMTGIGNRVLLALAWHGIIVVSGEKRSQEVKQ